MFTDVYSLTHGTSNFCWKVQLKIIVYFFPSFNCQEAFYGETFYWQFSFPWWHKHNEPLILVNSVSCNGTILLGESAAQVGNGEFGEQCVCVCVRVSVGLCSYIKDKRLYSMIDNQQLISSYINLYLQSYILFQPFSSCTVKMLL